MIRNSCASRASGPVAKNRRGGGEKKTKTIINNRKRIIIKAGGGGSGGRPIKSTSAIVHEGTAERRRQISLFCCFREEQQPKCSPELSGRLCHTTASLATNGYVVRTWMLWTLIVFVEKNPFKVIVVSGCF